MKKANLFKITAIVVSLVIAGEGGYICRKYMIHANANQSLSEDEAEEFCTNINEDTVADLNQYEQYEPFGLEYNSENKRFYYNNQLVRYFKDQINSDGSIIGFSYLDGEVDIIAKRDSSYKLEALISQGQSEYDKRTEELSNNIKYLDNNYSIEEGYLTTDDSLASYEKYGVKYEKQQDLWSYNGQIIRAFYDEGHQTYLCPEDSGLSLIVTRDKSGNISSIVQMTNEQFQNIFQ